jgi:hypothetical protein
MLGFLGSTRSTFCTERFEAGESWGCADGCDIRLDSPRDLATVTSESFDFALDFDGDCDAVLDERRHARRSAVVHPDLLVEIPTLCHSTVCL